MKRGRCPKCDSHEVYSGCDVNPKIGPFTSNAIPVSLLSVAPLDNYVCVKCGYVERYVADAHKLREIADRWKPVKTGGKKPAEKKDES
jgi:predicted nucleic-acid-binding Zn-ribbon protein